MQLAKKLRKLQMINNLLKTAEVFALKQCSNSLNKLIFLFLSPKTYRSQQSFQIRRIKKGENSDEIFFALGLDLFIRGKK